MTRRSTFFYRNRPRFVAHVVVIVLIITQFFATRSITLYAATAAAIVTSKPKKTALPPDPTAGVKVNRTIPKLQPAKTLTFSANPGDAEFFRARVLGEPLVPVGRPTTANENKALAAALITFAKAGKAEDTEPLIEFMMSFPDSPWRASLLANMGALNRSEGYWSKAMADWEDAWKLTADATEPKAKAIGDYVLGELSQMNARVGRFDRLEELFAQIGNRDVRGPATEKLAGARQGLALMNEKPENAFRCGPMALERILIATKQQRGLNKTILESRSTRQGISLVQVNDLARTLGMKYQMAKRSPGAQVIYPSVVNWKVGHYAALIKEDNKGRYLSQDPTFTDDVWVSTRVLDEEGSGYYLVPEGALPPGWEPVTADEGKNIWGKGSAGSNPRTPPPCVAPQMIDCQGNCTGQAGMATYNADISSISLSINDKPLSYNPPKGPAVEFIVSYTQREVSPASIPTYSNLGNKWSFNWLSYLVVDPNNDGANIVGYGPGGGTLDFGGLDSTTHKSAPQLLTQAIVVKLGPTSYQKRFKDGSVQDFNYSDGLNGYGRKIFMTRSADPRGNALNYTYDGSFRLVAVTDSLGQVTTLNYDLPNDSLKVTKVTDPFGRQALLEYNGAGQLWKITDPVGIVSQFTYANGDFINKMTTPYGDTRFTMGESGSDYRFLEVTDPEGAVERIEYNNAQSMPNQETIVPGGMINVANDYFSARNTFYWDKRAMREGAGVYSKAKVYHWLHSSDMNVAADVVSSTKMPLENRVWYEYDGATGDAIHTGATNLPVKIGRVLDDGTTQLYKYEYNAYGKVTKVTDPIGRITAYVYDTNGIDLLEVRQQTGGINELLASYSYNGQHLPLTATDASRQPTIFSYTTAGQIHTIENAKHEVSTYNYDSNGYLQNVTGALPGAITSFGYDGFGRLRTVTDSENYGVVIDYDAIGGNPTKTLNRVAKLTYPDGTYEQITYDRLDPEWTRDRLGRWSRKFYDSLRHVVATQDPLNRFVLYDWCGCGSLEGITDANHNTTSWKHDVQGRVTDKFYADQTSIHYTYEQTTSRLKTVTDAMGQNTNYTYYGDSNLKQVSYTNAVHATPTVNYTYDPIYNRLLTMTDGTGPTSYGYNPVTGSLTTGAGRRASVNGPLDNDTITYGYDELGRGQTRSINGPANTASAQFDSIGRVQTVTNLLGTFNYSYVNSTSRLDHVDYPNGQKVQYAYFDNSGDQRLKQIKNLDASNALISQFDYTFDRVGNIFSWSQSNSGQTNPQRYDFGYDSVNQLRAASLINTVSQSVVHQQDYDYDAAGHRKTAQLDGAVTTSSANNLNQLTSQSSGGQMHFRGKVDKSAAVTVAGNAATVDAAGNFDGVVNVNTGYNTVPVIATDVNGNTRTNNYQVDVPSGGATANFVYDLNGNLTYDGQKSYEWDGADRLIAVDAQSHRTEIQYDGFGRRSRITEMDSGNITAEKQFLWCDNELCEERDASGASVIKRFFGQGEQRFAGNDAGPYFYARDHLGSVRELTDASGTVRARYNYDVWGYRTKLAGNLDCDFGFTGFYFHSQSELNFSQTRAYASQLGKWINRDLIAETGGLNLYEYVGNSVSNRIDPSGLWYALIPGTWFDGNGYEGSGSQFFRGSDFDDGGYAALDAMNPFGNPFADNGYIKNCNGLGFSRGAGKVAAGALALAGFAGAWGMAGLPTMSIGGSFEGAGFHMFYSVTANGVTTELEGAVVQVGLSNVMMTQTTATAFGLSTSLNTVTGIPIFFPAAAAAVGVRCPNCVSAALGAVWRGWGG